MDKTDMTFSFSDQIIANREALILDTEYVVL
jgi:hypothetical protein